MVSTGNTRIGDTVSWIVTLRPPLALFPDASVAAQTTGVTPSGKSLPDGVQSTASIPTKPASSMPCRR